MITIIKNFIDDVLHNMDHFLNVTMVNQLDDITFTL